MNNLQETVFFPFQDSDARRQFLFASLVMLAGFIIPFIPMMILTGYSAKIMRQIIEERRKPSMPDWQTSDWSEMLMDGLRIYGARFIYMLPIILIMLVGFAAMFGGSLALSIPTGDSGQSLAPIGLPFMFIGMMAMVVFSILMLPYTVIITTVLPHVAVTRSFASAFQIRDWWSIFHKALGQFVLAFVITMAISWVFMFIMQIAMATIVLLCIVPFVMIPYTAYNVLLTSALYSQAYVTGLDNLKAK